MKTQVMEKEVIVGDKYSKGNSKAHGGGGGNKKPWSHLAHKGPDKEKRKGKKEEKKKGQPDRSKE